MPTLINIGLMVYFALVSFIGTFGNGIILLAYGNRWNSSKSTSVIFILILACVDLWTCLIVVPTIAVMEYREFEVPTLLCRFYSFSKILIIISSLIMSFIALDRFLNIAVPHYRLLNPRRVKCLLTLFISIGIGLGILTALAFSSGPYINLYIVNYTLILSNEPHILKSNSHEISLIYEQQNSSTLSDIIHVLHEQASIPESANITNISLSYKSTHDRCFADTSIISETIREILRHISNKFFFISIGIVTILYTITFLLALHRQNPRIRALKKSLNVLNKFDAYPSNNHQQQNNQTNHPKHQQRNDSIGSTYFPLRLSITTKPSMNESKRLSVNDNQHFEMSSFISNDEVDDQNLLNKPNQKDYHINISEATSDDLLTSTEKMNNIKQVSFQIENSDTILNDNEKQHLSSLLNSFDDDLDRNTDTYCKFPCPCSTTRQLLVKFHFAQPTLDINQWLCYCCMKKPSASSDQQLSITNPIEEESSTILTPTVPANNSYTSSNSETLKRQLHRHRLKQIRMASTFLLITVSFVLFYLPSILNAERYIKSPLMIYYLYLWTHALNPLIYCFMNRSLRAYIFSMLKCRKKQRRRSTTGATTIFER